MGRRVSNAVPAVFHRGPHLIRGSIRKLFLLTACAAALTALSACEASTQYRVLSMLFDGVPRPEALAGVVKNGHSDETAPREQHGENTAQYLQHGPYAAKLCEGCHQKSTNALTMPVEDLCAYCHELKTDGKKVHGPLASGGCRVCHDPHGSQNRFLLVSDSRDFCLTCHDRNEIMTREVHANTDDACTSCHNAHASDSDFLLK